MNRFTGGGILTALLFSSILMPADTGAEELNQQELYARIDPYLVAVEYKAEMTFLGQSDDIEGRVMGISVQPQGMIIFDGTSLGTGSHLGSDALGAPRVEKPRSVKITDYRGKSYDAEYIGVDPFSSIAFCRLPEADKEAIPAAEFKDGNLSLGARVYIFWMLPKGYQPRFQMARTVITGLLSKPENYFLTGELNSDFITAPVVTPSGDLVGIITPVTQTESPGAPFDMGNAFGIPVGIMPVDHFIELLAKPPAPGEFQRGWLGISMQALDPEVAAFWDMDVPGGIVVSDVIPHSPAEKAGLLAGDFIIQVDGSPIEIKDEANLSVFQKMISELGTGADMHLTVARPGDGRVDTIQVQVHLGDLPTSPNDAPRYEDKNFDLTIRDLVFVDFNVRNLDPDEISGVVVDKQESGGWAAVGGLRPGDIIMKINDGMVTSVDEGKKILGDIEREKKAEAVFMVWRFNKTLFVNVKTHW